MTEQRKTVRYSTLAKVIVEGVNEGETLLKDISVIGCRVECATLADIKLSTRYKLDIVPEATAKIDDFELLVEPKWTKASASSYEIGFVILESPKGEQFQRYVDYLSWRNAQ